MMLLSAPLAMERPGWPAKSIATTGDPAKPGAVVPLILTGLVRAGRAEESVMVPAVEKAIVLPTSSFDCSIAQRSVPEAEESAREVTV